MIVCFSGVLSVLGWILFVLVVSILISGSVCI